MNRTQNYTVTVKDSIGAYETTLFGKIYLPLLGKGKKASSPATYNACRLFNADDYKAVKAIVFDRNQTELLLVDFCKTKPPYLCNVFSYGNSSGSLVDIYELKVKKCLKTHVFKAEIYTDLTEETVLELIKNGRATQVNLRDKYFYDTSVKWHKLTQDGIHLFLASCSASTKTQIKSLTFDGEDITAELAFPIFNMTVKLISAKESGGTIFHLPFAVDSLNNGFCVQLNDTCYTAQGVSFKVY